MAFVFTCPYCQTATEVDDRFAGQTGKCYCCNKPIELPKDISRQIELAQAEKLSQFQRSWLRIANSLAISAILIMLSFGFVFGMYWLRMRYVEPAPSSLAISVENLRQIGVALNAYHAEFGCFPPVAQTDKNGVVVSTWRTAIAPYLAPDRYPIFGTTIANNSTFVNGAIPVRPSVGNQIIPMNQQLPDAPKQFVIPDDNGDTQSRTTQAFYRVVYGGSTAFPGTNQTTSKKDFMDGLGNTILVVESLSDGQSWLNSLDISIDSPRMSIASKGIPMRLGGLRDEGMLVLTADGTVWLVPRSVDPLALQSAFTINGNEQFQMKEIGSQSP